MIVAALIVAFSPLDHLVERVRLLLDVAAEGALDFLLALVVALVGWALAELFSRFVRWLLRTLKFNEGARALLGWRGDRPQHEPASVAGWLVYWSLIAVSLMLALDTLGLSLSLPVAERLAEVLPRVVVAAVLLIGVAILIALVQLGFAAQFVMWIGIVAVGAIAFAVALAFGLGCRDLARDFLVEYLRSLEDDRP